MVPEWCQHDFTLRVVAVIDGDHGQRVFEVRCSLCKHMAGTFLDYHVISQGMDPEKFSIHSFRLRDISPWCSGSDAGGPHDYRFNTLVKSNGTRQVSLRCRECSVGRTLKFSTLRAIGIDPHRLPADRSYLGSNGECIVAGCLSLEVEWHHFAPIEVFGDEAERWPVMPLCREHHADWHIAMTGYAWGSGKRRSA